MNLDLQCELIRSMFELAFTSCCVLLERVFTRPSTLFQVAFLEGCISMHVLWA